MRANASKGQLSSNLIPQLSKCHGCGREAAGLKNIRDEKVRKWPSASREGTPTLIYSILERFRFCLE